MACATMFASCQKDADLAMSSDGGMVDVTVTAAMEGASATTRAIADYGTAKDVDRCIMEVYLTDGTLYKRMVSTTFTTGENNTRDVTFDLRLVASQTYDFLFWADDSDNSADKYYNTENTVDGNYLGLKNITTDYGSYKGSDESRDAFFGNKLDQKITASVVIPVTLTRPFGQLNVSTDLTDVPDDMCPQYVKIKHITKVATSFDVENGTIDDEEEFIWDTTAEVIDINDSKRNAKGVHLSTDYIFAPVSPEQKLVDFEMEFYAADGTTLINTNTNFKSIPVQRNYRTNVSGELLTKQGTINVTINPIFDNEDNQTDVGVYEVASVNDIAGIVEKATTESVYINVVQDLTGTDDSKNSCYVYLPKEANGLTDVTIEFTKVSADTKITVGGDNDGTDTTSSFYTQNLYVVTGDTDDESCVTISSIYIYADQAHVEYTGKATTGSANTSVTTFVLVKNSSIRTLTVEGGNVEVHGTVGDDTESNKGIIISETNTTTTSIDVYDGGTVYNAAPDDNTGASNQAITITTYDSGEVKTVDSSFTIVAAVSEGATEESALSTFTSFLESNTISTLTLTEDITLSGDQEYTASTDKTVITSGQIILDGTTTLTDISVNYTGKDTFIVPEGATIKTLTITSGNVEIYGTVSVVEVADDNQVEGTITMDKTSLTTIGDLGEYTIIYQSLTETIEVVAGGIVNALTTANVDIATVTSLSFSGSLNSDDCDYIRKNATNLQVLDLTEASVSGSLTNNGADQANTIGIYAFKGLVDYPTYCLQNLVKIYLPKDVEVIAAQAFGVLRSLETIVFPEESKLTTLSSYCFGGCGSLKEVILPTSVTTLESGVFAAHCNAQSGSGSDNLLERLVAPGVTTVSTALFSESSTVTGTHTSLKELVFGAEITTLNDNFLQIMYTASTGKRNYLTTENIDITLNENQSDVNFDNNTWTFGSKTYTFKSITKAE